MSSSSPGLQAHEPGDTVATRPRPRFGRLITTGLLLGMFAGLGVLIAQVQLAEAVRARPEAVATGAVFYVMVFGGVIGGFAGALLAIFLDGRSARKR